MDSNSSWVESVVGCLPGYEEEVFSRYAQRLLAFAHSRLPRRLSRRLDADDVIQSVFRSFFRRNEQGEFHFEASHDVWQLLAAMTYRKVVNTARFHHRDARDAGREQPILRSGGASRADPLIDPAPGPEDIAVMADYLEWILSQLPEHYQRIVQLRLEGASIAEVSDEIKLSQRTIKRVLAHVRDLAANGNPDD